MYSRLLGPCSLQAESYFSTRVPWPGGRGIIVVSGLYLTEPAGVTMSVKSIPAPYDEVALTALQFPVIDTTDVGQYAFDLPPCTLQLSVNAGEEGFAQVGEISIYRTGP